MADKWDDFCASLNVGMGGLLAAMGADIVYEQPGADSFALTVSWSEQTGQPTTAWLRLSDFPTVGGELLAPRKDGDTITRKGRLYHVIGITLDGTGGATLELRIGGRA